MKAIRTLGVILLFVASILACSSNVDLDITDTHTILTLTMTEDEVEDLFRAILVESNDPLMRTANVDLRPGIVHVSGVVIDRNTGRESPGTLGVQVWQENGNLQLAVTEFEIANMTAQQAGIARFNSELKAGLARSAERNNSESEISNVSITGSSLSVSIKTPRND